MVERRLADLQAQVTRLSQVTKQDLTDSRLSSQRPTAMFMLAYNQPITLPFGAGNEDYNITIPPDKLQIWKGDEIVYTPGTALSLDVIDADGSPGYPLELRDAIYDVSTEFRMTCAAVDAGKLIPARMSGCWNGVRTLSRVSSDSLHLAISAVVWSDWIPSNAVGTDQGWGSIGTWFDLSSLTVAPTLTYFAHTIMKR